VRQCTGHTGAVFSVHFSSDGKQLASASADGTARLWDVAAGSELKKFGVAAAEGERAAALYDVALSANSQTLATGGADALVRVWNVASGQAAAPLEGHTDAIYRVTYNAAGTRLVTCGHAGNVNVWDASSGPQVFTTKLAAVAYYVALSTDGAKAVVACADGKAYVVDLPQAAR
jgi:WD40 repeat protein